jgi:hypothetical protein
MVARHPLDGENKINIRSNNSNNNLIDDDDAVAIWKPVGIDLEDSARINQEDNLKDSSFVLDDSESSPHPLPLPTNFCDDDSHEHRQQQQQQNQQQQQDHHLLFLDTTTSPVNCSPTEKLEDRITDLEIKLATLSRLWQAQENNRAHSHHRSSTTTRRGTLRHGRGRSGVTLVRRVVCVANRLWSLFYIILVLNSFFFLRILFGQNQLFMRSSRL